RERPARVGAHGPGARGQPRRAGRAFLQNSRRPHGGALRPRPGASREVRRLRRRSGAALPRASLVAGCTVDGLGVAPRRPRAAVPPRRAGAAEDLRIALVARRDVLLVASPDRANGARTQRGRVNCVELFEPEVGASTATFRWSVEPARTLYQRLSFELRFPDTIDLARVPKALWWRLALLCLHAHWALLRPSRVKIPVRLPNGEKELWNRLVDSAVQTLEAYRGGRETARAVEILEGDAPLPPWEPLAPGVRCGAAFRGGHGARCHALLPRVRERGSRERRARRPRRPAHPLHVLGGDAALRAGSHRAGGARLLVAHYAAPQRAGAAPPVAALPRPVRPAVLVLARGPGGGDLQPLHTVLPPRARRASRGGLPVAQGYRSRAAARRDGELAAAGLREPSRVARRPRRPPPARPDRARGARPVDAPHGGRARPLASVRPRDSARPARPGVLLARSSTNPPTERWRRSGIPSGFRPPRGPAPGGPRGGHLLGELSRPGGVRIPRRPRARRRPHTLDRRAHRRRGACLKRPVSTRKSSNASGR